MTTSKGVVGGAEESPRSLIKEGSYETDSSASQQYESDSFYMVSPKETPKAIAKTSDQHIDMEMSILYEQLVNIKDDMAKSASTLYSFSQQCKYMSIEDINAAIDCKMNSLNHRLTVLENCVKGKAQDNSKSPKQCSGPNSVTPYVSSEIFPHVQAEEYTDLKGALCDINSGMIGCFDDSSYVTYSNLNFGPRGTTKSIRFHYSKGAHGGRVELRLGGLTGRLIGTWFPDETKSHNDFNTVNTGIDDVEGMHDLTLVGKGSCGIMYLEWFELYAPKVSSEIFPHIQAEEYTDLRGALCDLNSGTIAFFEHDSYVTYSNLNFGPRGTTKSIRFHYSKGAHGGRVELRLGGPTGRLIGTWFPNRTKNYNDFITVNTGIDDVEGMHDLTLVDKGSCGIMYLEWFELYAPKVSSEIFPHVQAKEYTDLKGALCDLKSCNAAFFEHGSYVTYNNLNFGPRGTTKSIRFLYTKSDFPRGVELRLGGPTGRLIGTFIADIPKNNDKYIIVNIGIDDVEGMHNLALVDKGSYNIRYLEWFELSSASAMPNVFHVGEYPKSHSNLSVVQQPYHDRPLPTQQHHYVRTNQAHTHVHSHAHQYPSWQPGFGKSAMMTNTPLTMPTTVSSASGLVSSGPAPPRLPQMNSVSFRDAKDLALLPSKIDTAGKFPILPKADDESLDSLDESSVEDEEDDDLDE